MKKTANILLGLAVSAVCVWFALRGVSLHSVWHELGNVDVVWLIPAVATLLVALWIRAERWRLLFAPEERPPFAATFWALNIGYLFNSVLPARAGEIARVLALSRETGVPRTHGFVTVVVERVFDLGSLAVIVLVSLPFLPWDGLVKSLAVLSVAVLAACAVLAAVLASSRLRGLAARLVVHIPVLGGARAERTLRSLASGMLALRDPRLALPVAATSLLSWATLGVSNYLVLRAFGIDAPWHAAVLVLATTNLAQALPSSAAAIGVFELAAQRALVPYGVAKDVGVAYGVVLHAINVIPAVILGAIGLVRAGASGRELLHETEEEEEKEKVPVAVGSDPAPVCDHDAP